MRYSLNWIQEFTPWRESVPADDLVRELTLRFAEVEAVEDFANTWRNIVVGIITGISSHPNASKLRIADVTVGADTISLVCGGTNLEVGQPVIVALPGAAVRWHGEGELITLTPAEIRGVQSNGMICAAEEIGLDTLYPCSVGAEGTVVDLRWVRPDLSEEEWGVLPGMALSAFLTGDDVIISIENKTINHRPDAWSHIGMAREIAALFSLSFTLPDNWTGDIGSEKVAVQISDASVVNAYDAVRITGLEKVKQFPWEKRSRLFLCGERSVNPVVDVANYVMLETGQPLHTFDAKAVSGINVRRARAGEQMVGIGDKEVTLTDKDVVIADQNDTVVAVAGVLGSVESGVKTEVSEIVVEAATFPAGDIRKTSARLGLRTSASARFEKSPDTALTEIGWRRFVKLLSDIAPIQVMGRFSLPIKEQNPAIITVDLAWVSRVAGTLVEEDEAERIVRALGFGVSKFERSLSLTVPSWRRGDVTIPEDVAEEILRVKGYGSITPLAPRAPESFTATNHDVIVRDMVRDALVRDLGAVEMHMYSFVSEADARAVGFESSECWRLDNPLNVEMPLLRPSLVPHIARALASVPDLKQPIFELGRVFFGASDKPFEEKQPYVCVVAVAAPQKAVWPNTAPYRAKAIFETLSNGLGWNFSLDHERTETPSWANEHACAAIRETETGRLHGWVAGMHPKTAAYFGVAADTSVAVVTFLMDGIPVKPIAPSKQPSTFPGIKRDISIVMPQGTRTGDVEQLLRELFTSVGAAELSLFDVYRLPSGSVSAAWHLEIAAKDRTLSADDLNESWKKLENYVSARGWELRS